MNNVSVRRARSSDAYSITRLLHEFAEFEKATAVVSPQTIESALFGDRPILDAFVMDSGREICGLIMWYLTFSSWTGRPGIFIQDFYVRPKYRGQGYGNILFSSLADHCIERNYARMDWLVLDWNRDALKFYENRDAEELSGWKMYRLSGDALKSNARRQADG